MQAEPDVTTQFSTLLAWVLVFLFADGAKDLLGGAIIGSGKQAVTNPILFVSYWVLGLPLGALAAFKWPGNNLKGLWWGMTLAVWLHLASYLLICFGARRVGCAIDWNLAAEEASCRLKQEQAGCTNAKASEIVSVVDQNAYNRNGEKVDD